MKIIAAVLIATGLAACQGEHASYATSNLSRSYVGAGEKCAKQLWKECDGYRIPSEAIGGSE